MKKQTISNSLSRSLPLLRYITNKPMASRKRALKELSGESKLYNALHELAHNTISGSIPLNRQQQRRLKPHLKTLKNICTCARKRNYNKKKQLIEQSGGFLPIVLSALAGILPTLLSNTL